jgi:hypothetical protein
MESGGDAEQRGSFDLWYTVPFGGAAMSAAGERRWYQVRAVADTAPATGDGEKIAKFHQVKFHELRLGRRPARAQCVGA